MSHVLEQFLAFKSPGCVVVLFFSLVSGPYLTCDSSYRASFFSLASSLKDDNSITFLQDAIVHKINEANFKIHSREYKNLSKSSKYIYFSHFCNPFEETLYTCDM
jgi:hypothetical protein